MSPAAAQVIVGPYRLLRVLSEGPRGTVHEAVHARHPGERVAVRTLSAAALGRSGVLERMRRGGLAATGSHHPNIVTLHDCGKHEGTIFVATEFVEGDTLAQHLARVGRLPMLQGLALAAQLLSALDFAHRRQLVHGAIHPGNLLVSRTGQLKVAGFGWAAAAAAGPKQPGPFGDLAYQSPEQLGGAPADSRSDLHAAARVAHDLLAGPSCDARAFPSDALPQQVRAVVGRALARDPRERYASAAELSAALQAAVGAPRWERPPVGQSLVSTEPLAPAAAILDSAKAPTQTAFAGQSPQQVDVPAVRATHAVAARPSKPLSTRTRRTLGAAAAAVILVAAVFIAREPAPAVPVQERGQQLTPATELDRPRGLQASLEPQSIIDPSAWAGRSSPQAVEETMHPGEQVPVSMHLEERPATSSTALTPLAPPGLEAPHHPGARSRATIARSQGSATIAQREAPPRGSEAAPRAMARTAQERTTPSSARERQSNPAKSAQRSPIGLACNQAMAIGREICRAVRCVSPEFRRHPVCVRLDADRRARDAEREWRGSN